MDVDSLNINFSLLISLKENSRHKTLSQKCLHVCKVLRKKEYMHLGRKSGDKEREGIGGQGMGVDLIHHINAWRNEFLKH